MTKADVINEISDKTGIDKADVQASVEAFFTVVKNNMANGENVYVRGFGSFVNKKRAKKIARNISKNTAIVIDEHFIVLFRFLVSHQLCHKLVIGRIWKSFV